MKTILILMTLLTSKAYAYKNVSLRGEGRFYAKDDDSPVIVKKQLIHNATKDVLSKQLQKMNLDKEKFWAAYEQRFETHFTPIKDALTKKASKNGAELNPKQKQNLEKKIRLRKMSEERNFAKLNQIIRSYSVSKMSRSAKYPNSRFISMDFAVNPKAVYDIYYSFVSGNKGDGKITKVYIAVDYTVTNESWSFLGIKNKAMITDVVEDHWKKWFADQSALGNIEVEIARGNELEKIQDKIRNDEGLLTSGEVQNVGLFSELNNSLFVKLRFDIDRPTLNEMDIEINENLTFSGDLIIYEMRYVKPILYHQFPKTSLDLNSMKKDKTSSEVASFLYRWPLDHFSKIGSLIRSLPPNLKRKQLLVQNIGNVRELIALQDLIIDKGVTLRLKAENESTTLGKAVINLEYQGDEDKLKDLLLNLKNKKLFNSKSINYPYADNPYVIQLNDRG